MISSVGSSLIGRSFSLGSPAGVCSVFAWKLGMQLINTQTEKEKTVVKVAHIAASAVFCVTALGMIAFAWTVSPWMTTAAFLGTNCLLKFFQTKTAELFVGRLAKAEDSLAKEMIKMSSSRRTLHWQALPLAQKETFVARYSEGNDVLSKKVKQVFAKIIYQTPATTPSSITSKIFCWFTSTRFSDPVDWLSHDEIANSLRKPGQFLPTDISAIASAKYFHATNCDRVEKILKSGEIQVCGDQYKKGAFVSALHPEWRFGEVAFGFKRTIEYNSLQENCRRDDEGCWMGFSKPIPVTPDTLSCFVVTQRAQQQALQLRAYLATTVFHQIPVIVIDPEQRILLRNRGLGIPVEWVNNVPEF